MLEVSVIRSNGMQDIENMKQAALVDLIHHRAEMLLADEQKGQEFEHEAAASEVHA